MRKQLWLRHCTASFLTWRATRSKISLLLTKMVFNKFGNRKSKLPASQNGCVSSDKAVFWLTSFHQHKCIFAFEKFHCQQISALVFAFEKSLCYIASKFQFLSGEKMPSSLLALACSLCCSGDVTWPVSVDFANAASQILSQSNSLWFALNWSCFLVLKIASIWFPQNSSCCNWWEWKIQIQCERMPSHGLECGASWRLFWFELLDKECCARVRNKWVQSMVWKNEKTEVKQKQEHHA